MHCISIVRLRLMACLLVFGCIVSASIGCDRPSETDLKRLTVIKEIYGEKYYFRFMGDNHLEARLKKGQETDRNELISIYKLFFLDETMKEKRETTYIILNCNDYQGNIQYGLVYNLKKEFEFFDLPDD